VHFVVQIVIVIALVLRKGAGNQFNLVMGYTT